MEKDCEKTESKKENKEKKYILALKMLYSYNARGRSYKSLICMCLLVYVFF